MTNRRMQDSDYIYDSDDDLIGLTSAFPAVKGPQSVEYDKGDDAIGLTGAFAPITIEEDEKSWDESSKWKDFDWESYQSEANAEPAADDAPADAGADEPAQAAGEAEASQDAQDGQEASQQEAPKVDASAAKAASASRGGSGRGRHAAPDASMSPRMQKARKNRRVLILLVILVILIIICVGVYSGFIFKSSQDQAHEAEQAQVEAPKESSLASSAATDADNATAKLTDVPALTSLFGMTTDEAVKAIGHGAMALPAREVKEEGNPIKTSVNVSLNDEPIDSKTGAPTVYLGLDENGKVIQVGYSASAAALGFGSLSFADAVNNDHVIEKTFEKIGVTIPAGSVKLPDDKSAYSTYASDGTTVTRERCSFEGDVDVNGTPCTWSAVLSYDYTTQVVTGNLSDTVRVIYVYITKK